MRNYLEFIERNPEGVRVIERYELFKFEASKALWKLSIDNIGRPSIRFYTEHGVEVIKLLGGLVWRLAIDTKAERRPFLTIYKRESVQEGK